ncbi:MAG: HNH endonuclease signature motif containing protein [Candidatus Aminicenantales bacterium]
MPKRNPESIRKEISDLIANFEMELKGPDLRRKVLSIVPIFHGLRDLGKSLIPKDMASSARDRILHYFRKYPLTLIQGDELLVVSGIQEWARRLRELRVQFGWRIINGITAKQMQEEGDFDLHKIDAGQLKPDSYILLESAQDRDGAHRWNIANGIRRKKLSVRDKILEFLRANVGKPVSGEELRYVAKERTEWARRTRELRTEQGWPVATRNTGRPDLPVGIYVLQADRQSHEHDRNIPDSTRSMVLRRDRYRCTKCGWSYPEWNPSDPRFLELHHKRHHAKGGDNSEDNLLTLCVKCHDDLHHKEPN